jgi:hypothetical protein
MSIKLLIALHIETPFYLTLDADVVAVGELGIGDFVRGGRGNYVRESRGTHRAWWEGSQRILGVGGGGGGRVGGPGAGLRGHPGGHVNAGSDGRAGARAEAPGGGGGGAWLGGRVVGKLGRDMVERVRWGGVGWGGGGKGGGIRKSASDRTKEAAPGAKGERGEAREPTVRRSQPRRSEGRSEGKSRDPTRTTERRCTRPFPAIARPPALTSASRALRRYTLYRAGLDSLGLFGAVHASLGGVEMGCGSVWWPGDLPWDAGGAFARGGGVCGGGGCGERCLFSVVQSTAGAGVGDVAAQIAPYLA